MSTAQSIEHESAGSLGPDAYRQIGMMARQLHDTLEQLGLSPRLQQSVEGLSDARTRLAYVVRKTGESADRVLTMVDLIKREREEIDAATRALAGLGEGAPPADVRGLAARVAAASAHIGTHLTEIMLAQDFHDLTGQVVARVVALAVGLEDDLVRLLLDASPRSTSTQATSASLEGPVLEPAGADVVHSQSEVDDLLESLGF